MKTRLICLILSLANQHSVKIVVPGWQYFNCWRNAPDYQKSGFKSHSGLSLAYLVCESQYLTANKTVVFLLSQNRETNHGNEVARHPFVFFKSSFCVTLTHTSALSQMAYQLGYVRIPAIVHFATVIHVPVGCLKNSRSEWRTLKLIDFWTKQTFFTHVSAVLIFTFNSFPLSIRCSRRHSHAKGLRSN